MEEKPTSLAIPPLPPWISRFEYDRKKQKAMRREHQDCKHYDRKKCVAVYADGSEHYTDRCIKCGHNKFIPWDEELIGRLPVRASGTRKRRYGADQELKARNQRSTFYASTAWLHVRYQAIRIHGRKCQACGDTQGRMHVDHIKPRSKYPELELDISNLQILCEACNMGKSNKYEDDWRVK